MITSHRRSKVLQGTLNPHLCSCPAASHLAGDLRVRQPRDKSKLNSCPLWRRKHYEDVVDPLLRYVDIRQPGTLQGEPRNCPKLDFAAAYGIDKHRMCDRQEPRARVTHIDSKRVSIFPRPRERLHRHVERHVTLSGTREQPVLYRSTVSREERAERVGVCECPDEDAAVVWLYLVRHGFYVYESANKKLTAKLVAYAFSSASIRSSLQRTMTTALNRNQHAL